jgi:hypothetical protein
MRVAPALRLPTKVALRAALLGPAAGQEAAARERMEELPLRARPIRRPAAAKRRRLALQIRRTTRQLVRSTSNPAMTLKGPRRLLAAGVSFIHYPPSSGAVATKSHCGEYRSIHQFLGRGGQHSVAVLAVTTHAAPGRKLYRNHLSARKFRTQRSSRFQLRVT